MKAIINLVSLLLLIGWSAEPAYENVFCDYDSEKIEKVKKNTYSILVNAYEKGKYSDGGEFGGKNFFNPEKGNFTTQLHVRDHDNYNCPFVLNDKTIDKSLRGDLHSLMQQKGDTQIKIKVIVGKQNDGELYRMINDFEIL